MFFSHYQRQTEKIAYKIALLEHDNNNSELTAAIIFSRKRRIGVFRKTLYELSKFREKDMAKLARAGFNYRIAYIVINAETTEELEEMVENNISGQYK